MHANDTPQELLRLARLGQSEQLGYLLAFHRDYLRLLAQFEIGRRLQSKVDASDLVQETMLEAHRHFGDFRGESEGEFVAWLRQILAGAVMGLLRRYLGTQRRDVRLEQELRESLDRSSLLLARGFMDGLSSPSQQAVRHEQGVLLANAMAKLSDDYRRVLILRHFEGLSFPEISKRIDRSLDSVQKLWVRGLARLKQELKADP
jgi:RNA polymerase sigma-70 factor (ECF subfamily)